jgi:general secretion pathway protein M
MSALGTVSQLKERAVLAWMARTEQERKFLGIGGAVAGLALVYSLLVDPALTGIAKLNKSLPKQRQDAAQLQALALEAGELARQPVLQPTPMTREGLSSGLVARGMTPTSLSMTGEYAKLQFTGVSFANLVSWLDAQRREHRIAVQDLVVTAQTPAGNVDAALTLRQDLGTAQR